MNYEIRRQYWPFWFGPKIWNAHWVRIIGFAAFVPYAMVCPGSRLGRRDPELGRLKFTGSICLVEPKQCRQVPIPRVTWRPVTQGRADISRMRLSQSTFRFFLVPFPLPLPRLGDPVLPAPPAVASVLVASAAAHIF